MKTETTKKSIPVSNLTLDLYLDYVKPAAIKAGLLEEVPAKDEWHEYTALHTDAAFADDVAHCMYCACMGQSYHDLTHEEIVRSEAERMLYQLDVTAEFDLHSTKDAVVALRAALAELVQKAKTEAEIPEADLDESMAEDAAQDIAKEQKEKALRIIAKTAEVIRMMESFRSAWSKGVRKYADELLSDLGDAVRGDWLELWELTDWDRLEKVMMNGATSWHQYSEGGCSLCYDYMIAERLCTPSELKRTNYGEKLPNAREDWLDVQARALYQAAAMIRRNIGTAIRLVEKEVA